MANHVRALIEFKGHFDIVRQFLLHARQGSFDFVDHAHRRSIGPLGGQDVDRTRLPFTSTIAGDDIGSDVLNRCQIAQINGWRRAGASDVSQFMVLNHRVHRHDRIRIADVQVAAGADRIARDEH